MNKRPTFSRWLMWSLLTLLPLVIFLIGYSWIVVSRYRPLTVHSGKIPQEYKEYRGVDHIHTTYSEGTATPEEVLGAAKRAGLDFIIVTDHNSMASWERSSRPTGTNPLLLKGVEVSTKSGHLLGLGLQHACSNFSRDAQTDICTISGLGGSAVLAHPRRPERPWTRTDYEGFKGIEIVNMNNIFSDLSALELILLVPQACMNESGALTSLIHFEHSAVGLWDTLVATRPTSGFFGADAHGPALGPFPSYEALFSIASLHLVSNKISPDSLIEQEVRQLLASGSFYIAIDGIARSTYVNFRAERNGKTYGRIGEKYSRTGTNDRLRLNSFAPEGSRVRLVRNGDTFLEFESPEFDIPLVTPGAYRVEIVIPANHSPYGVDRLWVVTNHIYVS